MLKTTTLMVCLCLSSPAFATECHQASWYGKESCVNTSSCKTANGEFFTGLDLTAAHRSLPFGTRLRVTYNGKSVTVRINDRGPAKWTNRDLDLSKAAARQLGFGLGKVCWVVL